jgi:hypothetical protein
MYLADCSFRPVRRASDTLNLDSLVLQAFVQRVGYLFKQLRSVQIVGYETSSVPNRL